MEEHTEQRDEYKGPVVAVLLGGLRGRPGEQWAVSGGDSIREGRSWGRILSARCPPGANTGQRERAGNLPDGQQEKTGAQSSWDWCWRHLPHPAQGGQVPAGDTACLG